ncbi:hypothetical protein H8S20_00995 [Clostridium sp. NSJ-6]|uniref:DUF3784 domain-containing protein n=1 Tax=Clostridium hominis TaxID=2763036 RepID=A0ABR7D897_9CLOT|nr:hypothetical protein [Clostridium hominis]MBC5627462.1 hypothetical protein [Clostridium hominis]MDU2672520.1 hypothetical protein [Clostridium sp.]
MKIIAILALVIGCIFSIYEMIDSNKLISKDWFKSLDRNNKIKATTVLKSFWKKNIILIALMIGVFLILISTFTGAGNRYENIISIVAVIFAILSIVISAWSRKEYNDKISKFCR